MYFFRISMADQAYELFNNLIAEPAITIAPNVENIRQKQKNKNEKKNRKTYKTLFFYAIKKYNS